MNGWKRISGAILLVLGIGLAPLGAALAQVKVTSATPSSSYQGTTSLEVVVTGSGFDPTAKVQFFVSGTTNPGGIVVGRVAYHKSSELVATVDIAEGAVLASYDIQVTLDSGRKGKGTTLFSVKPKPNDPLPAPTYPAARAWHSFTSAGGSGRLYMYGGSGSDWQVVPADLWFYTPSAQAWTLVSPAGTTNPGSRQHNGLSCAPGVCVMAMGNNGVSLVNETWVYSEATNAWALVGCRRGSTCPSARQMTTQAFDAARGTHVLFGGRGASTGFDDTWTFDTTTLKWTVRSPAFKPSERNRAAATHVPGIGVVMHGGQAYYGGAALCDLFAWNGSDWSRIAYDASQPHPCLHSHSPAWDGQGFVVAGGYVDTSDTPSTTRWRFTFAPDGRSGAWSQVSMGTCQPIGSTDAVIHEGARMAYDSPTATRVFFGGEVNTAAGVVRFDNTVECR